MQKQKMVVLLTTRTYFGTRQYNTEPIARNMKLGNQTDIKGDIIPRTENVVLTVLKSI